MLYIAFGVFLILIAIKKYLNSDKRYKGQNTWFIKNNKKDEV